MKNIYIGFIVFILVGFASDTGFCVNNKVHVYFSNGILNELSEAKAGLATLMTKIEPTIQGTTLENSLVYDVSHNQTEGLLEDLLESADQLFGLTERQFWRMLGGLEIMPDGLQEQFKDYSSQVTQDLIRGNQEIQDHIKKYNEQLCSGNKVVVVAHSQGNLYANIAYLGIEPNVIEGFGIVSVANPDYYVAGGGPYTSLWEDQVVAAIPTAMVRNLNNFPDNVNYFDWSGHKFVDSYFAEGRPAETKIANDILSTINTLQWPEGTCQEYLLVEATRDGLTYCFVWDLVDNEMADNIPLNGGGLADLPVPTSEISNWLLDKSTISQDLFAQTDRKYSNPEYLIPLSCEYGSTSNSQFSVECSDSGTYPIPDFPDNEGNSPLAITGFYSKGIAQQYSEDSHVWSIGTYEVPFGAASINCIPQNNVQEERSIMASLNYRNIWDHDFYYSSPYIEDLQEGRRYEYEFKNPFDSNSRTAVIEKDMKSYRLELIEKDIGGWYWYCTRAYERDELFVHKFIVEGSFSENRMFAMYGWEAWKSGVERYTTWDFIHIFILKQDDWMVVPYGHDMEPWSDRYYAKVIPREIKCFYKENTDNGTSNMNPFDLTAHGGLTVACNELQDVIENNSSNSGPGVKLSDFQIRMIK